MSLNDGYKIVRNPGTPSATVGRWAPTVSAARQIAGHGDGIRPCDPSDPVREYNRPDKGILGRLF